MKREQICVKAWESTVRKSQAAAKKRVHSLFPSMSVANVEEDADGGATAAYEGAPTTPTSTSATTPTGGNEVYHAERLFHNGDFFTGQWCNGVPHGTGKYLWTDGCMYVGEWYRGKTMGMGEFSWPSGATYEGEFNKTYMDGKGTYTGTNGNTYRGSWVMNLKHGHGIKHYSNGDYYEGDWRRGVQDGHGRYQWKNGNTYIGQWKNGAICGNGTLIWSNGNRYDGFWDDGLPKGNGTFKWADGSFYVGTWSKDAKEQNGTYYPSGSTPASNLDWDPQEVFSVDLHDCKVCPTEKISMLPSHKTFNWSASEGGSFEKQPLWRSKLADLSGRPRPSNADGRGFDRVSNWDCNGDMSSDDVDGNVMVGRDGDDASNGSQFEHTDLRGPRQIIMRMQQKEMRRQGITISKGHRNYELMLNLQLGIRHSVGRPAPATSLDLRASAFDPKEKLWTRFPPEGSKSTPPHQSCDFRWKDYCPLVFRTLRKLFKVDSADYMISICGNDALRELSSPGKSGSFFYLTNDDRYMIKTMKKSETKVLLKMLPEYYKHVRAFENTLVTKFFGLHCVKLVGATQRKVRFVIMGNLFCSKYVVHRRFDLKGSSHGRITDKPEEEIDGYTTLKDLDLNFIFRLHKSWFQDFQRQVDKDCDFLENERIMDYSLLVGVHFREASTADETTPKAQTPTGTDGPDGEASTPYFSRIDPDLFNPTCWPTTKLGINMAARAEETVRQSGYETQLVGDPTGEFYDVILTFGIIDILQDYDITKKLEHAYKSFQYDATSISAVDPRQYSRRFRDFIYRVFIEDV
ncbi:hypothetical protein Scep_012007 [Stephania cephalantha]|uniref:Phosphatidylinositol 4-phosphate 5-kinase n=1 Tax=Stephania cephalantha TaxID=152367 RepID=A0AAP0JEC2_9MAGN